MTELLLELWHQISTLMTNSFDRVHLSRVNKHFYVCCQEQKIKLPNQEDILFKIEKWYFYQRGHISNPHSIIISGSNGKLIQDFIPIKVGNERQFGHHNIQLYTIKNVPEEFYAYNNFIKWTYIIKENKKFWEHAHFTHYAPNDTNYLHSNYLKQLFPELGKHFIGGGDDFGMCCITSSWKRKI